MTKYSMYQQPRQKKVSEEPIHPIWRGIGCILLILVPLLSYFTAEYFISNSSLYNWVIIPKEIILYGTKYPLLLVKILYTAIFSGILYLLFAIITFAINKFFGASRYGPYDVPPDKVKRSK